MIREAASVILLRPAPSGFEVFLVCRHRGASFMASSYVFPGGGAEPGEDARGAAVRELFEEAGVLLARAPEVERSGFTPGRGPDEQADTLEAPSVALLRKRILDGAAATETLAAAGLAWATEPLVPWAHWITPSVEPKRFSARFFVAELPAGQVPKFDATETIDQTWLAPGDAPARAAELRLPPPQLRTLWELAAYRSVSEVLAAGRARAEEPHPILPRRLPGEPPCLLLPWDPDYVTGGAGDAAPLTYTPSWARGPSRFVLEDRAWKHVAAPGSTTAG